MEVGGQWTHCCIGPVRNDSDLEEGRDDGISGAGQPGKRPYTLGWGSGIQEREH